MAGSGHDAAEAVSQALQRQGYARSIWAIKSRISTQVPALVLASATLQASCPRFWTHMRLGASAVTATQQRLLPNATHEEMEEPVVSDP
jgi:hypothetical protein